MGVDLGGRRAGAVVPDYSGCVGLKSTIDAGLARVFFSWTLHAIVYFWSIPTIAYYTIVPRAIGGKIYSDTMARIAFVLFLVVSMPIRTAPHLRRYGFGAGFKFIHSTFTALVALPTRRSRFAPQSRSEPLRGERARLDCGAAMEKPGYVAVAFSFVMSCFGGAGGLINIKLPARFVHPQHPRTLPPDFWWRDRHHVFCDRL